MALNLGSTRHRAVEPHRCENCGRRIEPGQTYIRARIVDGGEAWVWKSHDDCQEISEILFCEGIEGEDGCLPRVQDMDQEERDIVRRINPDLAVRMWPDQKRADMSADIHERLLAEKDAQIADLRSELEFVTAQLEAVLESLPPEPGLLRKRLREIAEKRGKKG